MYTVSLFEANGNDGTCCIAKELCCFDRYGEDPNDGDYCDDGTAYFGEGKTLKEAWEDALSQVEVKARFGGTEGGSRLRLLYFVRWHNWEGKFADRYDNHEFMEVVEAHPMARKIGTWRNANSGNEVTGFLLEIKTA